MESPPPRQMTSEEVRAEFLDRCWTIVEHFAEQSSRPPAQRIAAAVMNVLAALDGEDAVLPPFHLIPAPGEGSEAYHRERGRNWYPRPNDACAEHNIAGPLHDEFYDRPGARRLIDHG